MAITPELLRTAHADAWQAEGQLRAAVGGGVAELPGARLMASGLDHPQWNNADIDDPGQADVEAIRAWYAVRGRPWGVRVPAGAHWPHGEFLFRKRLMGLDLERRVAAADVPGLVVRRAGPADLDAVLGVDAVAFGEDPDVERPWIEPHLNAPAAAGVTVALAELAGRPVATAYSLRTDGRAGPALYLAGVAVRPEARRRGIAAQVSSFLLERAAGARIAHLHPDSDEAARVYARLGFVEVAGLDIYVRH